MTLEDFNNTKWSKETVIILKSKDERSVSAVDFDSCSIGIKPICFPDVELMWIHYSLCNLKK